MVATGTTRRCFLRGLGLGAAGLCVRQGLGAGRASATQPNIVIILADDLGYGDIGCYGNKVNRTPHLDQLAREGMRFTDFHANGPMCSPTRAALLTGRYQHRYGRAFEGALSAKSQADIGLPLKAVTIADALRTAGYATGMFGKWHLGYKAPFLPTRQGFDEFRGLLTGGGDHHSHINRSGGEDWWHDEKIEMEEGYSVDLITRYSIDFMKRHEDQPVFVYVAHLAIHFPWQGPGEKPHRVKGRSYWDLTKLGPHGPGKVAPVVREMVEAVDRSVGEIVGAIRKRKSDRPTVVFFASDNGGYLSYSGRFKGEISSNGPLRGQKGSVFEGGHRVPAIAWWPGRISPISITNETAMTMDLMPTFLELAGVKSPSADSPDTLDGTTLSPVLSGQQPLAKRDLFWRMGGNRAVRRGPWKLVWTGKGKPMLFNLDDDIGETRDLVGKRPDLVKELQTSLARWEADVSASARKVSKQ